MNVSVYSKREILSLILSITSIIVSGIAIYMVYNNTQVLDRLINYIIAHLPSTLVPNNPPIVEIPVKP